MLNKSKIIIATHVYTTGPAQDLKDYLVDQKIADLLFIGHPLFYDKKLDGSGFERYKSGKLVTKKYQKIKKRIVIWEYKLQILKTINWVLRTKKRWDLFVGSDNLNALSGIILRRLGRVKRVVYYVIDYNPHRFSNRIMNWIYHKIDQFCVKHADETWNLSARMEEARKEHFGIERGDQITVPIGIWYKRFEEGRSGRPEKNCLIFMGHILKKQGVQYVIDAIPAIIKKIPDFKFRVIGGGEYLDELKKQAEKLKVLKYIDFTGFIESHTDVERLMNTGSLAMAMYEKYDENGELSYTYYADPGKLKSYLAGGLPILLTDVPHNAKEIERMRCGKIIEAKPESITRAVVELMKDEKTLKEYRKNAIKYAEQFDWEIIFSLNLERVLDA